MAKVKIIWNKKYNAANIWAYDNYIVTVSCDKIEREGPLTIVRFLESTVMVTSNETEILEAKE